MNVLSKVIPTFLTRAYELVSSGWLVLADCLIFLGDGRFGVILREAVPWKTPAVLTKATGTRRFRYDGSSCLAIAVHPSSHLNSLARFAMATRLAIMWFSVLCNVLIADHIPAGVDVYEPTLFHNTGSVLSTFTRWDSSRFLRIAETGYSSEESFAFLPLYPFCIRIVSTVVQGFCPWIDVPYSLVIAGIIISNTAFVAAAISLYELGKLILKDEHMAFRGAVLFCLNPANVFMSTVYSESLYSFLSFSAMKLWADDRDYRLGDSKLHIMIGLFFFASLTRTNGVVHVGLFAWKLVAKLASYWNFGKRSSDRSLLADICPFVLGCIACALPVILYDWFATQSVCFHRQHLPSEYVQDMVCSGSMVQCGIYRHIQAKHWHVGVFEYWSMKQVPNFMLAFPALILCFSGVHKYSHSLCVRYGSFSVKTNSNLSIASLIRSLARCMADSTPATNAFSGSGFYSPKVLPFVMTWGFICGFALININVQVVTRLSMSSCPAVYWYLAHMIGRRKQILAIVLYFIAFNFFGPLLHSNWYPWT